jgi:hypothetical protein
VHVRLVTGVEDDRIDVFPGSLINSNYFYLKSFSCTTFSS